MNVHHNRFCEKFECPYYLSSISKIWYLQNNSKSDKLKIGQTKSSWFDPTWCNIFLVENLGLGLGRQDLVIMHPCPCFFYSTCYVGQRNRSKWFPCDKIIEIIFFWQNRDHFLTSWCDGCNFGASVSAIWYTIVGCYLYCLRRLLIGWWLDTHIYIHMVLVTPHTQFKYNVYAIFLDFWKPSEHFY